MISSAMFHCKTTSINTCMSFYPLCFCKNIHCNSRALHSNKAKSSEYKLTMYAIRKQSPQILLRKKSQGNFKMLTEVVCLVLHSLNLAYFRPLETHVSEACTLLHWQSCVVDCRENNHRNPTDHNSHDRTWSGGGREKQFSQLTLSQAFEGLIRS